MSKAPKELHNLLDNFYIDIVEKRRFVNKNGLKKIKVEPCGVDIRMSLPKNYPKSKFDYIYLLLMETNK